MPRPLLGFAVPTKSTWPVTVIPARTNPAGWKMPLVSPGRGGHFSAPVNASSATTAPGYFPSAVLPPPTNRVPLAYAAVGQGLIRRGLSLGDGAGRGEQPVRHRVVRLLRPDPAT